MEQRYLDKQNKILYCLICMLFMYQTYNLIYMERALPILLHGRPQTDHVGHLDTFFANVDINSPLFIYKYKRNTKLAKCLILFSVFLIIIMLKQYFNFFTVFNATSDIVCQVMT